MDNEQVLKAFNKLMKQVWASQTPTALTELTLSTGQLLFEGMNKSFVNYDKPDHTAMAYIRANIFAFSHAKSLVEMKELSNLVTDKDHLRSFAEFEAEAAKINDRYNRNYLRTEYETVVASGQMARRYLEVQADKDVFPLLRWDAINDERTRPEHARLNGITLPADDNFWKSYWPPAGWGCRCDVQQVRSGKKTPRHHAITRAKEAVQRNTPFHGNAIATGEVIKRNHSYFPGQRVDYNSLSATKDYALRPAEKIYLKGGLPRLKPGFKSRQEWEDHFAQLYKDTGGQEGKVEVKDVLGRPVKFGMNVIGKGHSQERYHLGGSIMDVLMEPDEVYSDDHKGQKGKPSFGYRYVKFYSGKPVIVVVQPDKTGLNVKTVVDVEVEKLSQNRKGILHYVDRF